MPDLSVGEGRERFDSRINPRVVSDLLSWADIMYCMHWATVDGRLKSGCSVFKLPDYVIEERRRALEWCFSCEDWDDISLDT